MAKYNDTKKEEKRNSTLRISFSFAMFLVGALAVVLTEGSTGSIPTLIQRVGLAFIVAGVAALFAEIFLEKWKKSPVDIIPDLLGQIHETGMKMICYPRKGFWQYHTWMLVNNPQDLFFAGRSVLHRIQEDFRIRRLLPVEDAFIRKLEEGSKIKILFCDPTWDLIPQLAEAEGQSQKALYIDLATSMGIVYRLWENLKTKKLSGEIDIRLYDELVQYAYHSTHNLQTNEKEMLIGFYFAKRLGCKSPLFKVDDESIQSEFEDHFESVFSRSKKLLEYPISGHGKFFDQKLFITSKDFLIERIGADEINKVFG